MMGGVHRRTSLVVLTISLVVLTIGLALGLMAPSAAANPLDEAVAPRVRPRTARGSSGCPPLPVTS